jgi:hypothetical protein
MVETGTRTENGRFTKKKKNIGKGVLPQVSACHREFPGLA